ncbi:hypothetical protein CL629_01100 [bacterium]|nr:hypothetical protein [bacterium]
MAFQTPETSDEITQDTKEEAELPKLPKEAENTMPPEMLEIIESPSLPPPAKEPESTEPAKTQEPEPEQKEEAKPEQIKEPEPIEQETEKIPTLEPRTIDLRSVVGLACNFKNDNGDTAIARGSGVIIKENTYTEESYILTNRHVVDPEWTSWAYNDPDLDIALKLTSCNVHILRVNGEILPDEKYPYAYYDLKITSGIQHDFTARLAYLPEETELSEDENRQLDYAILEVTGKNESKYFEHENPRLPASPILISNPKEWLEIIKDQRVVVPGYAYQAIGSSSFEEFRLLTKDAKVTEVYAGDKAFEETPYVLETESSPDAYGGRSGSPIFYKGYLIGLFQSRIIPEPNSKIFRGFQTTISAIIENMNTQANTKNIFQEVARFEK